ncbi:Alpha-galactosidase (Melibiase) [Durusdinium trenchii]
MGLDSGELSLDLFQLDDGWQSAWGDWLRPNAKFPNGLKPLTDAVKKDGLVPGIWLAPASLTLGSRLAQEHPEWILRDETGRHVSCGFTAPGLWMRALDTTMPEVLEHIRKTIHTIVHEWGFRYLKCDFLHCAAMPGKRFLKVSRAKACRMLLEAVREAAGEDVFVLACGAPLGPCIGVADAVRVSADTAEHWFPVGPNVWGTRWLFKQDRTNLPAARNMVCSTLARMHMNGRLWVNDPDCLIIRKEVPLSEAQALASVVAFSAGSVIFSDDLKSLPKERLAVLKALLPPVQPTAQDVHFTDGEIPCKAESRDWAMCMQLGIHALLKDYHRHRLNCCIDVGFWSFGTGEKALFRPTHSGFIYFAVLSFVWVVDFLVDPKVTAHLTGAAGDWRLCGLFAWDGGEVELMLDDQVELMASSFNKKNESLQRMSAMENGKIIDVLRLN